ncbi:MAG: homoserine dehydrogenase [Finegoldia sp.]|nr:homoserine dehydrogenase [Finegoldia sp.]
MKVALIGIGTVGNGAYDIIKDRAAEIEKGLGEKIEVSYIVPRKEKADELRKEYGDLISTDYDKVLAEVDAIVEATGAIEEGYTYMKKALENKVSVITANKAVVSAHFEELTELSEKNQTAFLYEASVGGGIPVLTPLRHLLLTNNVNIIYGILNGTSNYLLNKMFHDNGSYEETLKLCQELGYAEKDPTDDVEGFDSMRKLRILTTMAMGEIHEDEILVEGISKITAEVVSYAKSIHKKIKLVGMARLEDGKITAVLEPLLMDEQDLLSVLPEAMNIVKLKGNWIGNVAFQGPGAGAGPTGNAIVADLIDAARGAFYPVEKKERLPIANEDFEAKYFLYKVDCPDEYVEKRDGDFIFTKRVKRKDIAGLVGDGFMARVDEDYNYD